MSAKLTAAMNRVSAARERQLQPGVVVYKLHLCEPKPYSLLGPLPSTLTKIPMQRAAILRVDRVSVPTGAHKSPREDRTGPATLCYHIPVRGH